MTTSFGGGRIVDWLAGEQLPRAGRLPGADAVPPLGPADLRADTGTDNGHLGPTDAFGVPVSFTYPPAHPGQSPFPGEGYREVWARLRHRGIRTASERVRRPMRGQN